MCRLSVNWEELRLCRFRPSGGGFQDMRLYRSDAGWQERGQDIRADAVIVSMTTKLSLGMVASLQSPLLFHLADSLYLAS